VALTWRCLRMFTASVVCLFACSVQLTLQTQQVRTRAHGRDHLEEPGQAAHCPLRKRSWRMFTASSILQVFSRLSPDYAVVSLCT